MVEVRVTLKVVCLAPDQCMYQVFDFPDVAFLYMWLSGNACQAHLMKDNGKGVGFRDRLEGNASWECHLITKTCMKDSGVRFHGCRGGTASWECHLIAKTCVKDNGKCVGFHDRLGGNASWECHVIAKTCNQSSGVICYTSCLSMLHFGVAFACLLVLHLAQF